MIEMRVNFKEVGKDLLGASLNIYKVFGVTIAQGIWDEFRVLVNETAQYTGSTAASWNVAVKGAGSFGGVRMINLPKGADPLQIGHSNAVNVALKANRGNLNGATLYDKVLTSGINVWNESPGAQSGVPEHGPLRDENEGARGAFARFKNRVENKVYNPLPFQMSMKDFNIMANSMVVKE